MMKERQTGGKILKSAIAVLMAAAVLVLSLPAFKMDAWAVADPDVSTVNYRIYVGGMDAASKIATIITGTGGSVDSSVTIKSGQTILLEYGGPGWTATVSGMDGLASSEADKMFSEGGNAIEGTLYTLTSDVTFSISGTTVTFSASGGGSSSAEEPAKPSAVKGDPEAMARAAADMIAKYNAEQERIRQQREEYRIYQAKLVQAGIDNQYFRYIAEANANGKSMIVLPDHSALKSNVNGTYWANSIPGLAVTSIESTNPNLYIETWNITSKNAPKAMDSINGIVNEMGGTLVGALQVNIGEKDGNGKVQYTSENKDPVANVKFGVPNDGGKYAIVQVIPGGGYKTFDDLTIENGVATLSLPISEAAYAVVKIG